MDSKPRTLPRRLALLGALLVPAGGCDRGDAPAPAGNGGEGPDTGAPEATATQDLSSLPLEERRRAMEMRARELGVEIPPWPDASPRRSPISIELPTSPPTDDPVEPGTWVLSHYLVLAGGQRVDERQACRLELDGERVVMHMERSAGSPVRGTLRAGLLEARRREGEATFELRGQVTGPGRLVGRLEAKGLTGDLEVEEGRWILERVR